MSLTLLRRYGSGHTNHSAGDSFIGGFAARYAEDEDMLEAVVYGTKVASLTVTRPGAMKSIPSRSIVDQFQE